MNNFSNKTISNLIKSAESDENVENWKSAASHYYAALKVAPFEAELLFRLGACLRRAGNPGEALRYLEKSVILSPEIAAYETERGDALQQLRRLDEAVIAYNRAIELEPENVTAVTNLAIALQEGGHPSEALANLELALEFAPKDPVVRLNYGSALMRFGQLDRALSLFRDIVAEFPNYAPAWSNLAFALQQSLKIEEALEAHRKALAITPNEPAIRWNHAMTRLLIGDFEAGLRDFEARREMPDRKPRDFPGDEWRGESLVSKTILVHAEQGLGDTLQFSRFLRYLGIRGARVIFAVHSALADLIADVEGVSVVVAGAGPIPPYDYQIPLLSLPMRLNVELESLSDQTPYIVPPKKIRRLISTPDKAKRNIGIVWAGNATHANDRNRSCPLSSLMPLFDVPHISWFSLQVGVRAADIERCQAPLQDLSPYLNDFTTTAATISDLDLVISVDTAVAHLAGAMGTPVWILLPYSPDWRWMMERRDSPWYPSATLFRQRRSGDWDAVALAVIRKLLSDK